MFRTIRCRSCGDRFYVNPEVGAAPEFCQNCEGSYDPTEQLKADAAAERKANARPKGKPQSVDPRNPTKGSN